MSEFKGGDNKGCYRSDLDPGSTYDGQFRHFFNDPQRIAGCLPVLNSIIPTVVYIVAAGLCTVGGVALRLIDQDAQKLSVLEAKGNMRETKKSPPSVDELIRSRTTYNARAEECFRIGRCDDPKAAEIWQKTREVGYYDGLILTIPENSDGSPAKITLTESVRLLRVPGSCGLPDQNTLAGMLKGSEIPISQRYEVRKANGETEGLYLLVHPTAFPKNSKLVSTWIPVPGTTVC